MPHVQVFLITLTGLALTAFTGWLLLEMAITDAKQQTLALIGASMLVAMSAIALTSRVRR
jgi:hypothetical protein